MMAPNEFGWLWLEAVGVFIGVEGYRIRCYDSDKQPIEDPIRWHAEATLQRSQVIVERQYRERAEAKAEQAEIARLAAEARIAELEAKLQSLPSNNPTTP